MSKARRARKKAMRRHSRDTQVVVCEQCRTRQTDHGMANGDEPNGCTRCGHLYAVTETAALDTLLAYRPVTEPDRRPVIQGVTG